MFGEVIGLRSSIRLAGVVMAPNKRNGQMDQPTVHVCIYAFGSESGAPSIAAEFVSESEVDDWIRAFKEQLDDVCENAKKALRAGRIGAAK